MAFDMDLDVDDFEAELVSKNLDSDELDGEGVLPDIDFEALGIDPSEPTSAKPGSEQKVFTLAARYAAGLPLWHDEDCIDHGPLGAIDED